MRVSLRGQKESIRDYRLRLKDRGYEVPADERGMGAAESNVDRFKLRTAKRGRSCSRRGLRAILYMMERLYEGTLQAALSGPGSSLQTEPWRKEMFARATRRIAKKAGTGVLLVRQGRFRAVDKE